MEDAHIDPLQCPITFVLDILSPKWTIEILRELFTQPTRTRQFLNLIPGLSMKSLRERLKVLEIEGILIRTVYEDSPLRVEYSLTTKGRELYSALMSLKRLGEAWLNKKCQCPFDLELSQDDIVCPNKNS
ncbi:MAG: helix-turn-helix transcriptional regulator [Candidatus Obscuribacterales bacterium]|nr:helix-turn-helix transcriptional regulator [Candidatus Obscuribacterales bacterium]